MKRTGDFGEMLAARYLRANGFVILAQNYRAHAAEIDLVCEDQPEAGHAIGDLVFVEVKTRTTRTFGKPLEAVTPQKLALVQRAADHYLLTHNLEDRVCRFDVIGVEIRKGVPYIEHVRDVLDY
ncbi:MAG: YraN family protein [Bacteroidota bacterium]